MPPGFHFVRVHSRESAQGYALVADNANTMNRLALMPAVFLFVALGACTPSYVVPHSGVTPVITLPGGAAGTALALDAANQTAVVTVSETGYSGTFTAQSSATAVATVSPASGTSFTVTAIGAGTATVSFVDASGNVAQLTVTVTITGGVVSLTTRTALVPYS